jgi:hypothetical protein
MSEHDDKGCSEEKCLRCGWVMGSRPLNCNIDNTPHSFPSTAEALRQAEQRGYLQGQEDSATQFQYGVEQGQRDADETWRKYGPDQKGGTEALDEAVQRVEELIDPDSREFNDGLFAAIAAIKGESA